jgi:outer membrane protein assembly factor BamD
MPKTPQRDTRSTAKAIDAFTRLMMDFPNNSHAVEAQQWIEKGRNQLAEKIFTVGAFYEKMGDYDSAAKRFDELISQYSETKWVPESLAREIRDLRRSNQKEKADQLAASFLEKYPDSKFKSWIEEKRK